MRNVGENRVQNGVLDCPESKNEEKFLSIGFLASSRILKLIHLSNIFNHQTKNTHKPPSKLTSEAARVHRSHPGSSLQVLIVVLTADIRQIRITPLSPVVRYSATSVLSEQNTITELESPHFELYLVNPCGAERGNIDSTIG
ncbi:hypothetical protein E3N88_43145 [Mikania micrantha]|uniref:Uncharacterized protein n=1 Tax=Mikania micrantha TaxID=192012 RepID=A0A5N6LFS2_9ASTR|nr:hypothetical protein E3N88_43145 [Mikania micrantha]